MKKQMAAVEALMASDSISEAGRAAEVSRATMHRWLNNQDFQRALSEARGRTHMLALSRLCQAAGEAVTTLIKGMRGQSISKPQYYCARSVLEFAQAATASDIETRIEELESFIEKQRGSQV